MLQLLMSRTSYCQC